MIRIYTLACLLLAANSATAEEQWIHISHQTTNGVHEYMGVLIDTTIEDLASGKYVRPFIGLKKVFYYNNNMNIEFLSEALRNNVVHGYTNVVYLPREDITRFGPMDQELVAARLEEYTLRGRNTNPPAQVQPTHKPRKKTSGVCDMLCPEETP